MAVGHVIYDWYSEAKRFEDLHDMILYMRFPQVHEICPFQYSPEIDHILICCVMRNMVRRSTASELLDTFIEYFHQAENSQSVAFEAFGDPRVVGSLFTPHHMKTYACQAADAEVKSKLVPLPIKTMKPLGDLKWKRLDLNKILQVRNIALTLGDAHVYIKVRKEAFIYPRRNPFIFIQSIVPRLESNAIASLQEGVFQLVKDKTLKKCQALMICSVLTQLAEFHMLDQAPLSWNEPDPPLLANDYIFSETLQASDGHFVQSVLVPKSSIPKNHLINDYPNLLHSVLIEYAFRTLDK